MKKFWLYPFVIAVCSCTPELPDKELLVQGYYELKVNELKSSMKDKCRNEELERATEEVDSIIHRLMNLDLHDTLNFPSRRVRPSKPDHIIGTVAKFDTSGYGRKPAPPAPE